MADELEKLKATQIPDGVLFDHLRLDPEYATDADKAAAKRMLDAAVLHIEERCGIDDAYMDAHPDLAIAALSLARDLPFIHSICSRSSHGLRDPLHA